MKCTACGANAFDETTGICGNCGYAAGELNRCPHCNAVARIEGTGLAAVCAVCGGPRVPAGLGGEAATLALKEQKKHLGNARLASVATVLQGMFAMIATLIGLVVMPEALVGKLIVFAIAIVPLVLALRSREKAKAAREKAKGAAEHAWRAAAEDLAKKSKDGITVAKLAKTLGLELDHADKLLTALAVNDQARISVDDDAEVRFRSVHPDGQAETGAGANVGSAAGAGAGAGASSGTGVRISSDLEEEFAALEKQEAEKAKAEQAQAEAEAEADIESQTAVVAEKEKERAR